MLTVLSIVGTRPEAIKMAPVIKELAKNEDKVRSLVCVTAQHREMLDQVLYRFDAQLFEQQRPGGAHTLDELHGAVQIDAHRRPSDPVGGLCPLTG